MGETRTCSNCGLRYLKDVTNCPHCGQENWRAISEQIKANRHVRTKQRPVKEPEHDLRPDWMKSEGSDKETGKESDNLDLFEGQRR